MLFDNFHPDSAKEREKADREQSVTKHQLRKETCFYSVRSTASVQFVARAAMVPNAASHGAINVPTMPTVAGISRSCRPLSSFITIRVTFPSCSSCLTFSTRLSAEMVNSSRLTFATIAPQLEQYMSFSLSCAPHFQHLGADIFVIKANTHKTLSRESACVIGFLENVMTRL